MNQHPEAGSIVLCSAGLDSVVLLAAEATVRRAQPVYVQAGLAWEDEERRRLARVLAAPVFRSNVDDLVTLTLDMRDVYAPTHWALVGKPPAYDTPDEDVYLVGRNLTLLTKAGIAAAQRRISRVAIGPLAGNPFPDATPGFFDALARALSLGLDFPIEIAAPFLNLHKEEVVALGIELGVPLELTLSCMNPAAGLHCGSCSKCRERHDAFIAAGVADPTTYASPPGGTN